MPANVNPIYPGFVAVGLASLIGATPITSRANIAGTTGLAQLTPPSNFGKRVDRIDFKAHGTSVASNIFIWLFDGTTSRVIDEIDVPLNSSAGNTTDSSLVYKLFSNLVLPPTFQLFVSQTIATNGNVIAWGGDY